MKKNIYAILFSFVALCTVVIASQANNKDTLTVTFKMPEGHYYVQEVDVDTPYYHEVYVTELTLEVERGHVLTAEDVEPFMQHCSDDAIDCHKYCRVTMTGWDTDPVGVEVTEDMTFTAVMNEDVCKVKVTMSQGAYITFLPRSDTKYQSFEILVDKGYVLTEDDVLRFEEVYCGVSEPGWRPSYVITGFNKEPLGLEVTEDVEFTATAQRLIYVCFYIPDREGEYHYRNGNEIDVIEGRALPREELPDINVLVHDPDVVTAYWDVTDEQLTAIYPNDEYGGSFNIYGVLFWRGDANMDKKINTGDAVLILRNVANLEPLTENQLLTADMNADGEVNSGDATAILLHVVE